MSLGIVSLVLMLVFMLLAQFGALAVPLVAWIIWVVVTLVLFAINYRLPIRSQP
jgi:hypothetical protein